MNQLMCDHHTKIYFREFSMTQTMTKTVQDFIKKPTKSETLLLNELSRQKVDQGESIFRFGFGQSPFSPPSVVVKALQDNAKNHDYFPVQGFPELREKVADFHSNRGSASIDPSQVFVGPGSKQLILNIMALFETLQVVLVTPSWVSYEPQAHLLGHSISRIKTSPENRWALTPEQLDKHLATLDPNVPKLMILNYPSNPTGQTYTKDQLSALAAVLKQHQCLLISDEIYGFLTFDQDHVSFIDAYPEGCIVTSGLSKWCGAGGWRLGVAIVGPGLLADLTEPLLGIGSESYSSASSPVQLAAITAYSSPDIEPYLQKQKLILKTLGTHMSTALSDAGIIVDNPQGGFYIHPDFSPFRDKLAARNITTNTQLCAALLEETGVALLAGSAFGHESGDLTARLAFVDFDGDAIMAESELTEDKIKQLAPQIIEGAQRLVNWVSSL